MPSWLFLVESKATMVWLCKLLAEFETVAVASEAQYTMQIIIVTLKQRLRVWKFAVEMLSYYRTGISFTRLATQTFCAVHAQFEFRAIVWSTFLAFRQFPTRYFSKQEGGPRAQLGYILPSLIGDLFPGWAGSEYHKWRTREVPCYYFPRSQCPFPWSTVTLARLGHVKSLSAITSWRLDAF